MYKVLMLHLLGDNPMYLGAIGLVVPEETDCPIEATQQLWADFQIRSCAQHHLFIEWLVGQNEATEVPYCSDAPELPLQVYLQT